MEVKNQVLDSDEATDKVFEYIPKQFPISIQQPASNFVSSQQEKSSQFKISELVAEQSGIAELNRKQVEVKVEAEALDKLKEVEEHAYKEAYELGLIEGTEKAYSDFQEELKTRIEKMDELIMSFENIKVQLVEKNEQQLLKLLNLMASRIAMDHIESNKEIVLEVIKQIFEAAQTEEDVVLKVSQEDSMFIESTRERLDKKMDYLNRVKIEPVDEMKSGGCILETKYGAIDATLEQRLSKVWEAIEGKMPRLKLSHEIEEVPAKSDAAATEVDESDEGNE